MAEIRIDRLRLYARHGVMAQEQTVGNEFEVTITLRVPADRACLDDNLDGTVSYADVVDVIKQEMSRPSRLLEHVAWRIASAIKASWPQVASGSVTVAKLTPPIPSTSLASVSVTVDL